MTWEQRAITAVRDRSQVLPQRTQAALPTGPGTDLLSAFPVAYRARNKLVCFLKVLFVRHLLCRTVCHIPAAMPTGTKQLSLAARVPSHSSPNGWLPPAAAMCCWLSKAQNIHPRVSRGRQGCNPLQVI